MRKLSVVIITYNEEENIAACIDSVRSVADEIIVLDSFSTDRTKEICTEKVVSFHEHIFDGHVQQKNRAVALARNEFVLSLDADERLSEELQREIFRVKNENAFDGYLMNRLNFYCGRPVKTCGWYPDRKLRLWNRAMGKWTGRNPHDKYEMTRDARLGFLKGDILHNTYPTKAALQAQVEKFANISAVQLKNENRIFLWLKFLFSPSYRFFKTYFLKRGFTDGAVGLYICFMQSKEVWLKYWRALKQ